MVERVPLFVVDPPPFRQGTPKILKEGEMLERIPEYVTCTYYAGDQKATVTSDDITFTIVNLYGAVIKRVFAPIGSGDGTEPFAQPDASGIIGVTVNQDPKFLARVDALSAGSPSRYELYTDAQYNTDMIIVFVPSSVMTVPGVIMSPANPGTPTWEFGVNLEGHVVRFTREIQYASPPPFPINRFDPDPFSDSPSTNMGETTGQNSARSATGGQGAANTGTSSRGNQQAAANAGNPGSDMKIEPGGGISSGAGGDSIDYGSLTWEKGDWGKYTGGGGGLETTKPFEGATGSYQPHIIHQPINYSPPNYSAFNPGNISYPNPMGDTYRQKSSSSMGSAPMIIGGVSIMALLLLLAR